MKQKHEVIEEDDVVLDIKKSLEDLKKGRYTIC